MTRLEQLAKTASELAPLARLQARALRAATDPGWTVAPDWPVEVERRAADRLPLLHEQTLRLDPTRPRRLLLDLSATAERCGAPGARPLRRAVEQRRLDPFELLQLSLTQDDDQLAAVAERADVELPLLAELGQLLTLPLLRGLAEAAAPILASLSWSFGGCPFCAAWPTLAELRGLERRCWLRCGRCSAEWPRAYAHCAFCGDADHRRQGYLAAAADPAGRRVATCDHCHGYLKTFSTLGPVPPAELGWLDLTTLALDLAACDRGYTRPLGLAFPLTLRLEPLPARIGWLARR